LSELLLEMNPSCKEEVLEAKEKYNLRIRNYFSDKMGLSLVYKTKEFEYSRQEYKDRSAIQITMSDYVPDDFLKILKKYDMSVIRLLLHTNQIGNTIGEIDYQMANFEQNYKYVRKSSTIDSLSNTMDYFLDLHSMVLESGIWEDLKRVHPDLLGTYYPRESRLELHWLSISFLSRIHHFSIEDLVTIVLAHELAHGYSNLGYDKDGNQWETNFFLKADLRITEGFAQIYTYLLLKDHFPSALRAFEYLLGKQSIEYTDFRDWFEKEERDKYERTRRLLLVTRNKKIIDYSQFKKELQRIRLE